LVLGVGNLLLRDEGFGVHAVERFERDYLVSDGVEVLDGGTAGLALLDTILAFPHIIVVDVAHMNARPGTLARLRDDSLSDLFKAKQSAHDWGLSEILLQAKLLGHRPTVVVIAVEAEDMTAFGLGLSPRLAEMLPEAVACIAAEVRAAGGTAHLRS
jgi:hydrogenase maturation protease